MEEVGVDFAAHFDAAADADRRPARDVVVYRDPDAAGIVGHDVAVIIEAALHLAADHHMLVVFRLREHGLNRRCCHRLLVHGGACSGERCKKRDRDRLGFHVNLRLGTKRN